MNERGIVTAIENGVAVIAIDRQSEAPCGKCNACSVNASGKMMLHVKDATGLAIGDKVVVDVPSPSKLTSSVLVLLVPIVAFIIGAILANVILPYTALAAYTEQGSIACGFASIIIAFAIIVLVDRRLQRSRKEIGPTILEVEHTGEQDT